MASPYKKETTLNFVVAFNPGGAPAFSRFALTRHCATPRDHTMAGERRGENESQHYVGGGHGGARPERYSVGPKRGGRGGDNGGGRYLGYSCDNSLGFRV